MQITVGVQLPAAATPLLPHPSRYLLVPAELSVKAVFFLQYTLNAS